MLIHRHILNCLPAIALIALTLTGCSATRNRLFSKSDGQLQDPVGVYLPLAKLHEQSGNLDDARKSYDKVLSEDPKSTEAILGLARIDHLAGRAQEAEQGFLKALKMAPNDANVLHATGQHYAAQERWNESIDILNRAMQADPNNSTVRYHLAIALTNSGDINAARPHFARTIGDAEADYNIGYILYEQGKVEAAEHHFMQAVIKNSELTEAQKWLDEIRVEKEAKMMLASGTESKPDYEELTAPSQNKSNDETRLSFPQKTAFKPQPQKQPAPIQQTGSLPQQLNDSASAPKLTPQQLEQMRNQLKHK